MSTKKIFYFLLAGLFTCFPVMANDATDAHIAGHVLDAHTGEHLSFVNVQIKGTSLGCLTDESGHFYLKNLPEGPLTVLFSMMGYKTVEKHITLHPDTLIEMNVAIEETSFVIDNVVVTANRSLMSFRPLSSSPLLPIVWPMYSIFKRVFV